MNIYISHSREFDFLKELYEPLKNSGLEHKLIFPHETEGLFINAKELFKTGGCDLVVAEVSYPSTGQGMELAWAFDSKIKIVGFCKKGSKVSGSLKLVTDDILSYTNIQDIIEKLKTF